MNPVRNSRIFLLYLNRNTVSLCLDEGSTPSTSTIGQDERLYSYLFSARQLEAPVRRFCIVK